MIAAIRREKPTLWGMDWFTVGCILLVTAMLATLSVLRYTAYNASMFDIGNMTQAIWSGTRGRPLEFSYRGAPLSRLALHVELVYFLLVPLYALCPSPITLLLVQAVLFGAGAFPLYYLARRRIGSSQAARLVTLIYLLYPMAQRAVLFDFHGDTLAMPLLLFAIEALDRQAWRAYGVWLLLALGCKVYVAAPVCALGAFLWLKGRRRVGALTFLSGLTWGVVMFLLVRPLFATPDAGVQQSSAIGYTQFYYRDLLGALAQTWWLRLFVGLVVFLPVTPVVIYAADWGGLALLIALPVLLSTGSRFTYHYLHHHYAMVVPFLMLAIIKAAERLSTNKGSSGRVASRKTQAVTWPVALGAVVLMTVITNIGVVDTPISSRLGVQFRGDGWLGWAYERTSRDGLKDRWLARNVPDEAPILTSIMLAPHLANRRVLHTAAPLDAGEPPQLDALLDSVDYVVLDALLDYIEPASKDLMVGDVAYDWETLAAALDRPDFGLVSAQDGLLLLARRRASITNGDWAGVTLAQSVVGEPAHEAMTTLAAFADSIGLVEASVFSVGGGRYRFEYVWSALDGIAESDALFAVTQLAETDNARILHVPTLAMHPTTAWTPGEIITETFEVDLPDDLPPGEYVLTVGWYDSSHVSAYATDVRSRVGDSVTVGVLDLPAGWSSQ